DDLRKLITNKTKMMIINSPNNPCGSVTTKDDLEQIAEIAIENNIIVLSDEIYKDMYYEGEHYSITKFNGMKERTIILDGFSKSYAMTGWRLGYGIFPDFLVEDITKLMTNSVSCTSVFSQMAAIAALEGSREFTINMMEKFKIRRDIIVNGLNSIEGVTCRTPLGAFYAFPNISGTGLSSSDFADIALNEYGVALLSGTAFGEYGDDYIRISFANSEENLLKAIDRLNDMIKKL
ncbi:MAG: aminotransferase class I/II-fold pyridoxal phosphate-dependent enzyme, partial [SAR202 cluster bacterium]|nr:aminotransferase class I/II-fold pyridoxal phosphate-dependent enzyme [SAR202 cluster bacterium]